jgi:hypothetical protein
MYTYRLAREFYSDDVDKISEFVNQLAEIYYFHLHPQHCPTRAHSTVDSCDIVVYVRLILSSSLGVAHIVFSFLLVH